MIHDDDDGNQRGPRGAADPWALPPERGAASVREQLRASGEPSKPPRSGGAGFDAAVCHEPEDEEERGAALPQSIGGRRIDAHLGTGGMAEVFRAYERRADGSEEVVVIKRMLPHLSRSRTFIDMFTREAQVASGLAHPNIVGVRAAGTDEGAHFLVLDYVDGATLQHVAKTAWRARVPIPLELVAQAVADAALGLAHAHEARGSGGEELGLVHRDISPDNLMVDRSGVTRVLDFGIAKGRHSANITRTGEVKGKIPYMSPEQLHGEEVDSRADLYALGVTLYWLLTGTRPFRGDSDVRVMQAILMEHPAPPSALNPSVPKEINELVLALLEKDRARRPSSGRDVARRLAPLIAPERDEVIAFVRRMMDAPPSPLSSTEVSGPFLATSPTTARRSKTFSAQVAEMARAAERARHEAGEGGPARPAEPTLSPPPVSLVTPQSARYFDEEALRSEIVGPSPLRLLAMAGGALAGLALLAALAWHLLS